LQYAAVATLQYSAVAALQYVAVLSAFSRVLVDELVFAHPWCGRSRLRVASVHVHYKVAKTDPVAAVSDRKCHAHSFYIGLKRCLWRTKLDLLCGDFNMALYAVPYILTHGLPRMPKWPLLLSSYVWVKDVAGAILDEGENDSDSSSPRLRMDIGPPQPPPPPPPPPPARKIGGTGVGDFTCSIVLSLGPCNSWTRLVVRSRIARPRLRSTSIGRSAAGEAKIERASQTQPSIEITYVVHRHGTTCGVDECIARSSLL
jgi:hypothetical protein